MAEKPSSELAVIVMSFTSGTENTIRTHSKRIYAKLDIHKKQELLDLIESFDPNDLQE